MGQMDGMLMIPHPERALAGASSTEEGQHPGGGGGYDRILVPVNASLPVGPVGNQK